MPVNSNNGFMMMNEDAEISLDSIWAAYNRIQKYIHKTPVITSEFFNNASGRKIHFKCENFQKTGSFKYRGANNAVLQLKELYSNQPFVIVAHSSGNHALAISKVASVHGIEAKIIMPHNAPQVKRDGTKGYGATVVESGPSIQERLAEVKKVIRDIGDNTELIPPSDHPFVMEGAATAGLEFLEQVPELDAVIVCCSMGGLLSGVAKACKSLKPSIKVYGAEPEVADDMARSLKAGKRILLDGVPDTIADGLKMSVGVNTWPVIRENVDGVITVTEDEIVRSMYLIWEHMKVVVEPSGAVPTACALSDFCKSFPSEVKNVGVFLSGGNVDLLKIPWMLHPGKYNISL